MGARTSKNKPTQFIENPNPFTYFSTIDPDSVLTGQPFIQPSDQKKPPVPLIDDELQPYNLINLIEVPPHMRGFYPGLTLNHFNPYMFPSNRLLTMPAYSTISSLNSFSPILSPPIRTGAPLISPLISPPLAMPYTTMNSQAVLQQLYNKMLMRSNLALSGFAPTSHPLAMSHLESLFQSNLSFTQMPQPLMKSFTFQPFNQFNSQFNFFPPLTA